MSDRGKDQQRGGKNRTDTDLDLGRHGKVPAGFHDRRKGLKADTVSFGGNQVKIMVVFSGETHPAHERVIGHV